jgi:AbrB family looped-hinge helix DNA binding protein
MSLQVLTHTTEALPDDSHSSGLTARVIIGEKGRLVIPASIREALGVRPGDAIDMRVENHELHLSTRRNRMQRARERALQFSRPGRLVSDQLIAERRAEALAE